MEVFCSHTCSQMKSNEACGSEFLSFLYADEIECGVKEEPVTILPRRWNPKMSVGVFVLTSSSQTEPKGEYARVRVSHSFSQLKSRPRGAELPTFLLADGIQACSGVLTPHYSLLTAHSLSNKGTSLLSY